MSRITTWCVALVLASACGDDTVAKPDATLPASPLTLQVLSSRPDMVTAGDALVEISHEAALDDATITVTIDGTDVGSAFVSVASGRRVGLVRDLPIGPVAIDAALPDHAPARLELVTYPVSGPVISGPHQTPFTCRTVEAGLGPALDAQCSVALRYEHLYKGTDGQFRPLADPSQAPADVARIERTGDKVMIPYVVRVERGTINRAIYQITTLYDPAVPAWTATAPAPQWNKKLIYSFKGGCGVGSHQGVLQATDDLLGGVAPLADAPIAAGFAIASASLNTLGVSCNDVTSAETAMMVKERFIEQYGVPLYTTGWGGSGGSIQQHLIAENYPGILDGIVPGISYPDVVSIYPTVMDCPLLIDYFTNRAGGRFDDLVDRADVAGYANAMTCAGWNGLLGHLEDPTTGCDASIPASSIYNATTNPTGVRCTFVDNIKNLIGINPATGFAWRLYDNVGVQYGLAALNAGAITKEQFLHINEQIGGYGTDGVHVATRASADAEGLRSAYVGGRVTRGNKGLNTVPIVDLRFYTDNLGDIHDKVRSFAMRSRLTRANGNADNQVMLISSYDGGAYARAALGAIIVVDAWLTTLMADPSTDRAAAVRAARPANLSDLCVMPNVDPVAGTCMTELPVNSTPRRIAGSPGEEDILKCQLKTPVPADYTVTFTTPEWARLVAAFPSGVCDYTKTGVEQVEAAGTWQSFGPAP